MDGAGFFLEQRADDLDGALVRGNHLAAIERHREIFRMCADECAERFLRQPVNDATDPGPIGRAGTHCTALGARVHGALAEKLPIIAIDARAMD
jgi:hypothetical protein